MHFCDTSVALGIAHSDTWDQAVRTYISGKLDCHNLVTDPVATTARRYLSPIETRGYMETHIRKLETSRNRILSKVVAIMCVLAFAIGGASAANADYFA